jgi:hypothetical protein
MQVANEPVRASTLHGFAACGRPTRPPAELRLCLFGLVRVRAFVKRASVRASVCPAGHRAALCAVWQFDRASTPTLQLCAGGELPGDLRSFVRDGEILASAERAEHAHQHVHGEAARLAAPAGARPDASAVERRHSDEGLGSERSGGAGPGVVRLLDRRAGNDSQKLGTLWGLYVVNVLEH